MTLPRPRTRLLVFTLACLCLGTSLTGARAIVPAILNAAVGAEGATDAAAQRELDLQRAIADAILRVRAADRWDRIEGTVNGLLFGGGGVGALTLTRRPRREGAR